MQWSKPNQSSVHVSHCLRGHICIPSSQVFSRVSYIKTSFHLCLLQETFCPIPALSRHSFTCVVQQNIIWHDWLSKETTSFYFKGVTSLEQRAEGSSVIWPSFSGVPFLLWGKPMSCIWFYVLIEIYWLIAKMVPRPWSQHRGLPGVDMALVFAGVRCVGEGNLTC